MALVQIDNLVAGMTLKGAVCDRSGRVLLSEGAALEEKHLSIFRMWGVLEADINLESEPETADAPLALEESLDPLLLEEATAQVGRIFVHNDPEHPAIRELIRICIKRRAAGEQ